MLPVCCNIQIMRLDVCYGAANEILRLLALVQERSVLHRSEILHMCLGVGGYMWVFVSP